MEPLKALYALSTWLLRVATLVIIYIAFYTQLRNAETGSPAFWIAVAFALFAALLFVGGFMNKHGLTVLSAALLLLGSGYKVVMHYFFDQGSYVAIYFVLAAVSMFFVANGNRRK